MSLKCKICGNNENNQVFEAKEMMLGIGQKFNYLECASCGCLQLINVPTEMSRYYKENYYSINGSISKISKIKAQIKNRATNIALRSKIASNILSRKLSFPNSVLVNLPKTTQLQKSSKILEVGCGRGELLSWFQSLGFNNTLGLDPYSPCNKNSIKRESILEISEEPFDLIIFNHSFEHIEKQHETIKKVRQLLSNKGTCLIRMPVKTEYIWNRYGVNWVQLDAPRHVFLHTLESFEILAQQGNLAINNVIFDSDEFQFWGSEQYLKGILLRGENSYWVNPTKSIFKKSQIQQFRTLAYELNKKKQGDQAQFYLTKTHDE